MDGGRPSRDQAGAESSRETAGRLGLRGHEPAALEQGIDRGLATAEAPIELHGVLAPALLEHVRAQRARRGRIEEAALAERLEGVGVEHLAPEIAVVAGRVAARE